MKSLRFAFYAFLVTLLLLCPALNRAHAEDELPPPTDIGGGAAPAPVEPPPQELPDEELPSAGGPEDLPAPSLGEGKEDPANQVNNPPEEDNVFLPTPAVQDDTNFSAPLSPSYSGNAQSTVDNGDWKTGMNTRPTFSLYLGLATRNFAATTIGSSTTRSGPTAGFSIRMFDLGQTVFLHGYIDAMNIKIGDVSTGSATTIVSGANVFSHRYGGLLEVGVGRRISLFGTLLHHSDLLTCDPADLERQGRPELSHYAGLSNPPGWDIGVGIQYDFHVIPHGSLGIRGHAERDLYTVTFSLSLEPQPRKRLTL